MRTTTEARAPCGGWRTRAAALTVAVLLCVAGDAPARDTPGRERIAELVQVAREHARSRPQEALERGAEALRLLDADPDPALRLDALESLTLASIAAGDLEAAERHAAAAGTIATELGDPGSRARALVARASVLFARARYDEARPLAEEAEAAARRQSDPEVLSSTSNLLANLSFQTGDSAAALERYFAALAFAERIGRPEPVAMILNNIGSSYLALGDPERALEHFSRALAASERFDNPMLSATLLINMASIAGDLGDREEERRRYERALGLARELGHEAMIATVLINLSDVYLELGHEELAFDAAEQSLALSRELGNPLMVAICEVNVGHGLVRAGRVREGLERFESALGSFRELGAERQAAETLEILARTHEGLGEPGRALARFREFKEASDALTSSESRARIAEAEARYESAEREKEIALLTRDRELQRGALERRRVERNGSLAVAGLSVLLVGGLVQRYRFKVAAHRELAEVNAELERQALTDPLTRLDNRRALLARVDADRALALRKCRDRPGEPHGLAVLLVDVDHFKRINDRFGHAAGDQVLVAFAERLTSLARASDSLARWGGEEFLLLSRESDFERGAALAERIVASFVEHPLQVPGVDVPIRCSVGYAVFPFLDGDPEALGWEQVVGLADGALYLAKAEGRSRWVGVRATASRLGDEARSILLSDLELARARSLVEIRRRATSAGGSRAA